MLVWQLGGASTVWKLDYFTRWELCQAVDRGSKKFLLTVTAIYTFLCVVVLATFLALTIVDVQVRCLTASTSPSRRTSWAHLQPCVVHAWAHVQRCACVRVASTPRPEHRSDRHRQPSDAQVLP